MYIAVLRLGSGYRVDLIYKYVIRVSFSYNIGFFTKIYVFENRRECFGAKKKKKEGVLDPKIDFVGSISIKPLSFLHFWIPNSVFRNNLHALKTGVEFIQR